LITASIGGIETKARATKQEADREWDQGGATDQGRGRLALGQDSMPQSLQRTGAGRTRQHRSAESTGESSRKVLPKHGEASVQLYAHRARAAGEVVRDLAGRKILTQSE